MRTLVRSTPRRPSPAYTIFLDTTGSFEGEDWAGAAFGELGERLDAYIEWYRDAKPKKALGWRTTAECKRDLDYGHALAA